MQGRDGDAQQSDAEWRVDRAASSGRLRDSDPAAAGPGQAGGGWLVYTDEQGAQRRLPADMSRLSSREIAGAARATSYELGAVDLSYAQLAAIERLNELRSAGAVNEENYLREKRRLQELG
ncbi:MAG: hypothetical protein M3Z06_16515 [Actinomycetota bacterium]|nr:hypothetical protein [Actinomycetota bacterium]